MKSSKQAILFQKKLAFGIGMLTTLTILLAVIILLLLSGPISVTKIIIFTSVFFVGASIFGFVGWILASWLSQPLVVLVQKAIKVAQGETTAGFSGDEIDAIQEIELKEIARTINDLSERYNQVVADREHQVNQRTLGLQQRSEYLEAAAAVSQATISILEPNLLVQEVVDVICSRFKFYYVGLFLTDENNELAQLRAGSGTAGQAMLRRQHSIAIGQGMIGWSILNNQARVALKAETDEVRLKIPELPDTRSEAALPLRSRGRVIGAISVQSQRSDAFDESTLNMLQMMADQVAVAIDNARLFSENQHNLEAVRQAYTELSRRAWSELIQTNPDLSYHYDQNGIRRSKTDLHESGPEGLTLPIQVRGQTLGVLEATKPDGETWMPEERDLIEKLVEQLSIALDSARLYQETHRRAERERLASEITARLRNSNDPQQILQTAVAELRQALQAQRAQISIVPQAAPPPQGDRKNGHRLDEPESTQETTVRPALSGKEI